MAIDRTTIPDLKAAFDEERRRSDAEHTRRQDFDDQQRELSSLETGRMNRFVPAAAREARGSERGKHVDKDSASLSRLQYLLANNPAYAALYEDTFDKLRAAEAAAERVLNLALAARARAREALEDTLEHAATLPDGTRVFRDDYDDVRTEHGERVTGAESEAIAWPKDAPSYESYLAQTQAIAEANRRIDALRGYQVDVLGNIRKRMTDEDDPPSADELRSFQQTLDERMPDVTSTRKLDAAPDADPVATDKLDIPKL